MTPTRFAAALCAFVCIEMSDAPAQTTIVQWNFNSVVPDATSSTGSLLPSFGSGSFTAIGGVTTGFAAGSPADLNADNTALSLSHWPAVGAASGTAGAQFMVSTSGIFTPIQISFDLRQTATASERFQLQATTDGVNFSNVSGGTAAFGAVGNNTGTSFDSSGLYINSVAASPVFVQAVTYTFLPGSAFEDNVDFGFRLVSVFDGAQYVAAGPDSSYGTTGTLRIDLVTVSALPPIQAVPEPAANAAWIGLLAIVAVIVRRRRIDRLPSVR